MDDAIPARYRPVEPADLVACFVCILCGEMAGRAVLRNGADEWEPSTTRRTYTVDGVEGTVGFYVDDEVRAQQIADTLRRHDAMALRRLDPEYTPFFCPKCDASYCAAHWELQVIFDEGFYDYTLGQCPNDHVVKIGD